MYLLTLIAKENRGPSLPRTVAPITQLFSASVKVLNETGFLALPWTVITCDHRGRPPHPTPRLKAGPRVHTFHVGLNLADKLVGLGAV